MFSAVLFGFFRFWKLRCALLPVEFSPVFRAQGPGPMELWGMLTYFLWLHMETEWVKTCCISTERWDWGGPSLTMERGRERERAREQRSECATNRVAEPAILRRCDDMCMFLQDKRDGMYQVQQVLILRKSLGKWMVMFIEKGVQTRTLTQKANRPWLSSRDHDISRQVMFRCAWRMQQTPMTLHSGLWKNQTCIETPYLGCILDR